MSWPAVEHETLPWKASSDELEFIPKSKRRAIASTYEATVPATIATLTPELTAPTSTRLAELGAILARYDERRATWGFNLPSLLLRSESASSSQIENLTSSARNIALADISDTAPRNAKIISRNIAAMDNAMSIQTPLTIEGIVQVNTALMGEVYGIRDEQVWVGGTPYSPHGATYVPPQAPRVQACLEDLLAFLARTDIDPIAQSAIAHAQFETIHPFVDGNGRTGRALLHTLLRERDILRETTLPVSAGLLHDVDRYMASITAYQEGDPLPIIECLADALEFAVALGSKMAELVSRILEDWNQSITQRRGSAIHGLPALLVQQPVVNVAYVADKLQISDRAARTLLADACELGITRQVGTVRRGVIYQADEIIDVLDRVSSVQGMQRIMY